VVDETSVLEVANASAAPVNVSGCLDVRNGVLVVQAPKQSASQQSFEVMKFNCNSGGRFSKVVAKSSDVCVRAEATPLYNESSLALTFSYSPSGACDNGMKTPHRLVC